MLAGGYACLGGGLRVAIVNNSPPCDFFYVRKV